MAKAPKPKKPSKKSDLYEVDGDKLIRKREVCPTCGPGTFLAIHKNRKHCGRCSHTVFNTPPAAA